MSKAEPQVSCGGNTFTYAVAPEAVADAKRQLQQAAGGNPLIIVETPLDDGQVQLLVLAARLTAGQAAELQRLQDQTAFGRFASRELEGQLSFADKAPTPPTPPAG